MKKRAMRGLIALSVLAMSIGLVGTAAAAPLPGQSYQGSAFGTCANVANTVQSGQSSPSRTALRSAGTARASRGTNTTAGVNITGVAQAGAINTSVNTGPASGPTLSKSTSNIANVQRPRGRGDRRRDPRRQSDEL